MDDRALHVLRGGVANGLPSFQDDQHYLLQYFEQLKTSDAGWQICGDILASTTYNDDNVKFFCLQVLENQVKTRYSGLPHGPKQRFKYFLIEWLKKCCHLADKTFIRNKTAQVFCMMFVREFLTEWASYIHDLLALLHLGPQAVDIYLRILLAIDEEVVDRHIPHSPEEVERNTHLKDTMREVCVTDMVNSWYQILKTYDQKNPELTCLCLSVMGAYVSWIDITLIANERFVSLLLSYLNVDVLRESACDCLFEIVSKGMDPLAKTDLVESLVDVLAKTGVFTLGEDEDLDFVAKVSRLVNGIGVQLISSWQKVKKLDDKGKTADIIMKAIVGKLPYLFQFLGHSDDDIAESVHEFALAYLGLLKQISQITAEEQGFVNQILLKVAEKLKYDADHDFEHEGEDEVMFLEFRKQLKVILDNIGKLLPDLLVSSVHKVVKETLRNWQKLPFMDVEMALYLLYLLGEVLQGQAMYSDPSKTSVLHDMMSIMIASDVSYYNHPAVKLQYFETVTRYERYFYEQTQHIPIALMSFLDERGLRNEKGFVSSRTSYLLMRFVKALKNHLQPYVGDVLKRIHGLLVNNNGFQQHLSENDQNYLYEVSAILITCRNTDNEGMSQLALMETLLSPVLSKFSSSMLKMTSSELDDEGLLQTARELQSLMGFVSRASKAYSSSSVLKQSGCSPCFTEALKIFLQALNIPLHKDIIHAGVRQYLHRMIICLGEDVLPYIPIAVTHLLKDCEIRDIQEFIPLINQLIARFKEQIAPFLFEVFLPVVNAIFAILNAPLDENDEQAIRERQVLRRSYFLFISTLVNNGGVDVITWHGPQEVNQILLTVCQGATELPDPQAQKTCFCIFTKLTEIWGKANVLTNYKEFILENLIPSCLLAPMKPTFDLTDGQTALVLHEIAATLKMILSNMGQEIIEYLQFSYMPQISCPPDVAQEYCRALQSMDLKAFRKYLKMFYARWKL